MLMQSFRISAVFLLLFTILLGFAYPFASTVLIQALFKEQAEGSLIRDKEGKIVGSALIGQNFAAPKYFWGRPSATSPAYNAASSSGSNLSANNADLLTAVQGRVKALHDADPDNTAPIPVDLVTASGSGLDPHISPAGAAYQIKRVATARNMPIEKLRQLVAHYTSQRQLGVFGEPVVNVLKLNLALDGRVADGS